MSLVRKVSQHIKVPRLSRPTLGHCFSGKDSRVGEAHTGADPQPWVGDLGNTDMPRTGVKVFQTVQPC